MKMGGDSACGRAVWGGLRVKKQQPGKRWLVTIS